jgi:hypothetical protein
MNRRAFIQRFTAGALALAQLPVSLLSSTEPTRLFNGPITFRGVPFFYDQYCAKNAIYFMNPDTLYVKRVGLFGSDEWKALGGRVHG